MNRKILALVSDPFWRTKIDGAVKSAGAATLFVSEPEELAAVADPLTTPLLLVDLALRNPPFDAIAALKRDDRTKGITVVGYYEGVRKDLKEKAVAAGCDEVFPRPAFAQRLADIVLKHALPGGVRTTSDEEELPEE